MIKLDNIVKTFNKSGVNEIELYNGLNLEVNTGDFITVIGSNGSGKSTLFNVICGNIPIDSGTVIFDEKDITGEKEYILNREFARIFQDPLAGVSPNMTILENLAIAANKGKRFNLQQAIEKNKIEEYKEILSTLNLDLEDKLHVPVKSLSGGQRQALTLIMATLKQPSLLLLDEHTAALDPKTSELIIQLTNKIVQEKNLTTLMITHNLKQALTCGNRLIMMHKGKIIMDLNEEEKKTLTTKQLIERFNELNLIDDLSDEMVLV